MKSPAYILITLFLLLLIFLSFPSLAQESQRTQDNSEIYPQQIGTQNVTLQSESNWKGINNSSYHQLGNQQEILLQQYGTNNETLLIQGGTNNQMDIMERGNDITAIIRQSGSDNHAHVELNSDFSSIRIVQSGNGHELISTDYSNTPQNYEVKQAGMVGMTVIIRRY